MPQYSRKKHPYGFVRNDFKIKNLPNVFKLNKRPQVHQAAVDTLKALQADEMDIELTSTEQPQALGGAVSQFKDKFPSLFLVEPQKREYAVKHFLMNLHQQARISLQRAARTGKGGCSEASQTSTASPVVTRGTTSGLKFGRGSVIELTDNEEGENEDEDELDQLSVFARTSLSPDFQRFKSEESNSPTYVNSLFDFPGRQKRLPITRNSAATIFGVDKEEALPIPQSPVNTPSPTPIAGPQPIPFQIPPPVASYTAGNTINLSVGNGVTICISTGNQTTNAAADSMAATGANFIYEFLSTCQPPLTTLLPKFMKRGCGSQYFMRGISTWDPASRRALLEKIVMEPVDDGNVYHEQKLPPIIVVDVLEHQFKRYFLQEQG